MDYRYTFVINRTLLRRPFLIQFVQTISSLALLSGSFSPREMAAWAFLVV